VNRDENAIKPTPAESVRLRHVVKVNREAAARLGPWLRVFGERTIRSIREAARN
jgi:hypothetical protein